MKKQFLIGQALLLSVILVACSNNPQNTSKENSGAIQKNSTSSYYYTANEGGSISIIDVATNKVGHTIKEDGVVHNVQISPDGKVLGAVLIPGMDMKILQSAEPI